MSDVLVFRRKPVKTLLVDRLLFWSIQGRFKRQNPVGSIHSHKVKAKHKKIIVHLKKIFPCFGRTHFTLAKYTDSHRVVSFVASKSIWQFHHVSCFNLTGLKLTGYTKRRTFKANMVFKKADF